MQPWTIERENIKAAQGAQEQIYNREVQSRTFKPGDWVLLLLPSSETELLACEQRPFKLIQRVGLETYEIRQADWQKKKQLYHIKFLEP